MNGTKLDASTKIFIYLKINNETEYAATDNTYIKKIKKTMETMDDAMQVRCGVYAATTTNLNYFLWVDIFQENLPYPIQLFS